MKFQYRGWVPTVTGRLSFSHFGPCELHSTKSLNRADPEKRYVVAIQDRETWDVLLPFRRQLGEALLKRRGKLYFVCLAGTEHEADDKQSRLKGRIYILSDKNAWKGSIEPAIDAHVAALQAYFFTARSGPISTHFEPHLSTMRELLNVNCAFQGEFSLDRSGVVDICIDTDHKRHSTAPSFPHSPDEVRHIRHILAAQLFFFLRDIGHRHQHHHPYTDTIVDLYECNDGDDLYWRHSTLYSIYRRIISYKRKRDIEVQISSLGLLAYAKAFREICKDSGISEDKLPTYYVDPLRESIQASELRMRHVTQTEQEKSATRRTVLFWVVGTAISIAGLMNVAHVKVSARPPETLIWLVERFVERPFSFAIVVISAAYLWRARDKGQFRPERFPPLRYLQAILQSLPKPRSEALFKGIGVSLILAGLALFVAHWI